MSASPEVPKSPTLLPPHKGTEIEDPGAHELSKSYHKFEAGCTV